MKHYTFSLTFNLIPVLLGFLALFVSADVLSAEPVAATAAPSPAVRRIQSNLLPVHYLKTRALRKSIPQVMLEDNIPGVSMAFVDGDKVAWVQTYGYARLDQAQAVTADTVFAAASLSKPVTAMAALKLVDKGVLPLDEDVNTKLHGWQVPESELTRVEKVTLRRLIGHTAGVKNHLWSAYAPDAAVPTLEQMLAGQPPSVDPAVTVVSVPGEQEKYSNPGYSIIQKLVADHGEFGFDQAMDELVLTPAGMVDSSFAQPLPARLKHRAATGYTRELAAYPYQLFPFKAAGGMWTTPTDLARFMATVLEDYHQGGGRLISAELAAEVFAPTAERLGFAKKLSVSGDGLVFDHWGSNSGFTAYLVGALEQRQGVVIMTNSDNGFGLMAAIARAVAVEYGWPQLQPVAYEAVELDAAQLNRFSGRYNGGGEGDAQRFAVENGVLYLLASGTADKTKTSATKAALVPVGERRFILPATHTTYEFLANREGAIQWVRVTTGNGYNNDYAKAGE